MGFLSAGYARLKIVAVCFFFSIQVIAQDNAKGMVLSAALAEADYPPFYFKSNERLEGISIDVLEHVSRDIGVSIEYHRLSWPRVLHSLKDGSVDMVTTFFNTPERAPSVVYTGVPHIFEANHFFSLSDSNISYDGEITSVKSYRIGTIRGYSYGKSFDSSEYLQKVSVLDEATLVRMLWVGRFELAVGNPFAIKLQASKQKSLNRIKFLQPAIDKSPIYMAISRKHPLALQIASQLTDSISELKKTQHYQEMIKKYDLAFPEF